MLIRSTHISKLVLHLEILKKYPFQKSKKSRQFYMVFIVFNYAQISYWENPKNLDTICYGNSTRVKISRALVLHDEVLTDGESAINKTQPYADGRTLKLASIVGTRNIVFYILQCNCIYIFSIRSYARAKLISAFLCWHVHGFHIEY